MLHDLYAITALSVGAICKFILHFFNKVLRNLLHFTKVLGSLLLLFYTLYCLIICMYTYITYILNKVIFSSHINDEHEYISENALSVLICSQLILSYSLHYIYH